MDSSPILLNTLGRLSFFNFLAPANRFHQNGKTAFHSRLSTLIGLFILVFSLFIALRLPQAQGNVFSEYPSRSVSAFLENEISLVLPDEDCYSLSVICEQSTAEAPYFTAYVLPLKTEKCEAGTSCFRDLSSCRLQASDQNRTQINIFIKHMNSPRCQIHNDINLVVESFQLPTDQIRYQRTFKKYPISLSSQSQADSFYMVELTKQTRTASTSSIFGRMAAKKQTKLISPARTIKNLIQSKDPQNPAAIIKLALADTERVVTANQYSWIKVLLVAAMLYVTLSTLATFLVLDRYTMNLFYLKTLEKILPDLFPSARFRKSKELDLRTMWLCLTHDIFGGSGEQQYSGQWFSIRDQSKSLKSEEIIEYSRHLLDDRTARLVVRSLIDSNRQKYSEVWRPVLKTLGESNPRSQNKILL